MRVELQSAYLLHLKPYRNTSFLLDVLSCDFGRVSLLAKGVRKGKSSRRALLQPFNKLLLSWVGKTELNTMTHVEACSASYQLNGRALYSGFYLNELLVRLLHRYDPHEPLFYLYEQALSSLYHDMDLEPTLRSFEYRLLKELGYQMQLKYDANSNEPVSADKRYVYNVDVGPILSNNTTKQASIVTFSGKCFLDIAKECFDSEGTKKEIKGLMRLVLSHYLGDKPLKSRELFCT